MNASASRRLRRRSRMVCTSCRRSSSNSSPRALQLQRWPGAQFVHKQTLTALSQQLRARKISSVELTRHYLDRIEGVGKALNAFITVDRDKSLAQAASADARIGRGEAAPLTGIPIAHK